MTGVYGMKLDELIEALQKLRQSEDGKNCYAANVLVEVDEPDGIWFGEFNIDRIESSLNKHAAMIKCKVQKTNFLHARDRIAGGAV